jgi:hypothetical protein
MICAVLAAFQSGPLGHFNGLREFPGRDRIYAISQAAWATGRNARLRSA